MESLFFNITDTSYKVSELFKNKDEYIKRVDISNGLFFFDINLSEGKIDAHLKNLDRMIAVCVVKDGKIDIVENISKDRFSLHKNSINIVASSKQDVVMTTIEGEKTDVFLLCIADFFLKRYLSNNPDEPIDFLYNLLQGKTTNAVVNTQSIDALSLYIINPNC